jgi:hypothetical protein
VRRCEADANKIAERRQRLRVRLLQARSKLVDLVGAKEEEEEEEEEEDAIDEDIVEEEDLLVLGGGRGRQLCGGEGGGGEEEEAVVTQLRANRVGDTNQPSHIQQN